MSLGIDIGPDSYNITHNLGPMAKEAGVYGILWRGEGVETARDMIRPLSAALADLTANHEKFKPFNAANGWGLYEDFVRFVAQVLNSAILHPRHKVNFYR